MSGRRNKFEKIPTWIVVLGLVILCGVVSITHGFSENNQVIFYVSLAIAIIGTVNGIIFLHDSDGPTEVTKA